MTAGIKVQILKHFLLNTSVAEHTSESPTCQRSCFVFAFGCATHTCFIAVWQKVCWEHQILKEAICKVLCFRGVVLFHWGGQRGCSVPLEHWGWVSEGPFCSTGALGVGFRGAVLFNWNTGGGSSKKVKFLKLQYICHISVGYAVSGGCFIHPLPPSVLVLFFVQAPDVCCFLYRPLMRAVLCISP